MSVPPVARDILASYVPELIKRRLVTTEAASPEPVAERFFAAVLFADISGFTALTEKMAQQGPEGAEELTHLLNDYISQLIELVTAFGGDVVKFAGDGLLAFWTVEAEANLEEATCFAGQCALTVQARLNSYEVAEGLYLSLRIGIGAGEVATTPLGGVYGRWEILVAGAPLVQMSTAERRAHPGEVIVAPEAWAWLAGRALGEAVGRDFMRLEAISDRLPPRPLQPTPLPGVAEAALHAYIPGAIRSRLAAGQGGWLAELRGVTVIFINLPDLNFDTPSALAQRVMQSLQTALYRFEGSINKLSVDDKGTTLLAVLGLPPLAHEDDPTRAVQAALAMRGELDSMGLRSAVGIATGRAFCGVVGNEQRREYTVLGRVVNLAARLMQAATDDVFCDPQTVMAAQHRVRFQPLAPITVKGRSEPVAIARPFLFPDGDHGATPETQGGRTTTAIVGRMAERAFFYETLRGLQRGATRGAPRRAPTTVIIEGEAGIGKSRLLDALREQAAHLRLPAFLGVASAVERTTPYHAWRPVFARLFGIEAGDSIDEMRRKVLARLAQMTGLDRLAPLLNSVLPLDLPETEDTEEMSDQVRAEQTRDLLLRLFRSATVVGPTLLLLEDAQWLDSASWGLLLAVSRRIQQHLLLVIATRPLPTPPAEYTTLLGLPDVHVRRLDPLSPTDALALVCQRLGVDRLPEPVAALIQEKAEGHPFFSEELAYALRDSGLIHIVPNGGGPATCLLSPDAGDLHELSFPDTVQGVIISRIDRLSPTQQLTLKVASVIGRTFAERLLRDIYPIEADKPALADTLRTLEQLDLTLLERPEPELTYVFKHIITQEVAYNLMLFSQRRQLHRAVAEWYETTHAADLSPYYALLAHHWQGADEVAKVIDYLEKAGEQALRSYANREALDFFAQALALEPRTRDDPAHPNDPVRVARWERQRGEIYYRLGQIRESRGHFERALALTGGAMPAGRAVLPALVIQALRQAWHRLRPPQLARQVASEREREAVRAYQGLTEVYFFTNRGQLSVYGLLRALNLSERAAPSPELARIYGSAAVAASILSLRSLAEGYSRLARETADAVGDLMTQEHVQAVTGLYRIGLGQWDAAQDALVRAIDLADFLGDQRLRARGMNILAQVTHYRGEFGRSTEMFALVTASARGRDDQLQQAWGLGGQGQNALRLGRLDEAAGLLARAAEMAGSIDYASQLSNYGLLAVTHLRRGDLAAARTVAEQGAEIIATSLRSPTAYYLLEGYAGIAETWLTLWEAAADAPYAERETVARAARQAVVALSRYARVFPIGQPRALLWQGRTDWLRGKQWWAERAWHRSYTLARALGMPYEQALAHYELGRHAEGSTRIDHLARARELFIQLGAAADLARLEAAGHLPIVASTHIAGPLLRP